MTIRLHVAVNGEITSRPRFEPLTHGLQSDTDIYLKVVGYYAQFLMRNLGSTCYIFQKIVIYNDGHFKFQLFTYHLSSSVVQNAILTELCTNV